MITNQAASHFAQLCECAQDQDIPLVRQILEENYELEDLFGEGPLPASIAVTVNNPAVISALRDYLQQNAERDMIKVAKAAKGVQHTMSYIVFHQHLTHRSASAENYAKAVNAGVEQLLRLHELLSSAGTCWGKVATWGLWASVFSADTPQFARALLDHPRSPFHQIDINAPRIPAPPAYRNTGDLSLFQVAATHPNSAVFEMLIDEYAGNPGAPTAKGLSLAQLPLSREAKQILSDRGLLVSKAALAMAA